ncbi:uncharacterized protein M6B38_145440 [Iris pallida]|uniref:Uncharacterized protein n=1 Tax=Iris pallida TaxID=29817 RepID=A0AAX6F9W5_IRIPA|nr:uncharacterized protein M6B38_145440 [Iris pallida]
MDFHHQLGGAFYHDRHVNVSFQPGGGGGASHPVVALPGIVEPVPGLRHDTGLAVDWSLAEQAVLNDALLRFSDEGMMKYIKIAALLPEKTVRDVALRCQWMAKKESVKRRKLEENYARKKIKDRKEKMNSSAKASIHLVQPEYSFMMHHANRNNRFPYEVPAIDSGTQHLLEENVEVLIQISENLSTWKLDNNIDLFSHLKDNIAAILNRMSEMPGIMSQMPPLPVSVNEDLMSSVLPNASQALMFGTPSGVNLKQEPRC